MSSFQVFASTVQQAGDPVVVSSTLAPHLRLRTNPPFPSTVRRAYPSAPVPQVNPTAPYGTRAGTHPPGPIPFPRPLGGLPAENWLMREVAALQANIIRLPTGSLAIYQNRVAASLPLGLNETQLDWTKYFVQWRGRYLEVTDQLFVEHICPADLLGVPCEHDELPNGCQKIRLCSALCKYHLAYRCNDLHPILRTTNPCPHVHDEIGISCRFVANTHLKPHRVCRQVLAKNRPCSCSHDFEIARMAARDQYYWHWRDARQFGSRGLRVFGWQY